MPDGSDFKPWEPQTGPQTELIRCPVFEVFYGGARGGGKTDGVLGEWLEHADTYGEHAIGLMIRRTLKQLRETIARSKQIYRGIGDFNETDKEWTFRNGARLVFAYLERDADADNYQGHSYTRVYVEEIGNFPSPAPIMKLMATLRSGARGPPVGEGPLHRPGATGPQADCQRVHQPVHERDRTAQPRLHPVPRDGQPLFGHRVRREPAHERQHRACAGVAGGGLECHCWCVFPRVRTRPHHFRHESTGSLA